MLVDALVSVVGRAAQRIRVVGGPVSNGQCCSSSSRFSGFLVKGSNTMSRVEESLAYGLGRPLRDCPRYFVLCCLTPSSCPRRSTTFGGGQLWATGRCHVLRADPVLPPPRSFSLLSFSLPALYRCLSSTFDPFSLSSMTLDASRRRRFA